MSDQEQTDAPRHHREGEAIVFDSPENQKEANRRRREDEQHEFARSQVKTNIALACFTGALVLATFCTIGVGIWQAFISQKAANAAKSAAETASKTLAEIQAGQGAQDTHTLAQQAVVQSRQTANLAQTSRDALIQVQRAVMATVPLQLSRDEGPDGKVANLILFVQWKNVGGTPTKGLTFRHNFVASPQRLPDNFVYTDMPDAPRTNTNTPSFAAPQSIISETPITIPVAEAQQILDKKLVLIFWGHADYRDVFMGTPRHTSQYCFVVTGFYGNIYSTSSTDFTIPITENCKTHNCLDEECNKK